MSLNPTDMDPLLYEYNYSYNAHSNPYFVKNEPIPNLQYQVPIEMPIKYPNLENHTIQNLPENTVINYARQVSNTDSNLQKLDDTNIPKPDVKPSEDSKEDVKPFIKRKNKGKKLSNSNYFSKKIKEPNFPFFGCSICDISYGTMQELDQHVIIHKGRLTSYDLRLKNQKKRKKYKKQMKLLKKGKIKNKIKEEKNCENIEIKPEDGYIGNEKANEFTENNENIQNNSLDKQNCTDDTEQKGVDVDVKTPTKDPRLEKLFKCFACQKQFSLSYYLRLHVRSHTDEKPYMCQECGQCFITASKLGRHKKRIHLAIKYQCRICYKMFGRFDHLTRHFDVKHLDDKLEGEPYDFNAILPYLQQLQPELKPDDPDGPGKVKEEPEPRVEENLICDMWSSNQSDTDDKPIDDPQNTSEPVHVIEPVNIVEPANMLEHVDSRCVDIEIKLEKEEEKPEKDCKMENDSDDDYFPVDTWTTGQDEMPNTPQAPSPPPKKKKKKHKNPTEKHKNPTEKDKIPIKCEICQKMIKKYYMRIHLRTHTGEKPYKCNICGKGFITAGKMGRHELTHGDDWDKTLSQIKLENEMKTEENVDYEANETKRQSRIKKRKARQTDTGLLPKVKRRPFACTFCSKKYLHEDTLTEHLKSHEGEEKVYKCNFCLIIVANDEELKSHEATHSGPKPFLCTECGRSYTKRESMIYHKKDHDPTAEKKEFICDICSKTFNAVCKLQRHIISHSSERFVLRYECPVCAHMFHTKYHIQMHLSTHQKEGLILEENKSEILAMVLQNARKIPQKGDQSANLSDLIPSDERSRICNICGQIFQHFYFLEEHLKSHGSKISLEDSSTEDVKKHICNICNKGFKLHYYLKLHSFTHTKEKPFICQQCGKGFITKGKLKRHLETHTGLKKYQCHICYKFFTRPSYLRIHIRTIHGCLRSK